MDLGVHFKDPVVSFSKDRFIIAWLLFGWSIVVYVYLILPLFESSFSSGMIDTILYSSLVIFLIITVSFKPIKYVLPLIVMIAIVMEMFWSTVV